MLWRGAEAGCGVSRWESGWRAWPGRDGIARRVWPWFLLCSFLPSRAICDGSMGREKIRLYACAVRRQLVLGLDSTWWSRGQKSRRDAGVTEVQLCREVNVGSGVLCADEQRRVGGMNGDAKDKVLDSGNRTE
jgi:hypothetical protein